MKPEPSIRVSLLVALLGLFDVWAIYGVVQWLMWTL